MLFCCYKIFCTFSHQPHIFMIPHYLHKHIMRQIFIKLHITETERCCFSVSKFSTAYKHNPPFYFYIWFGFWKKVPYSFRLYFLWFVFNAFLYFGKYGPQFKAYSLLFRFFYTTVFLFLEYIDTWLCHIFYNAKLFLL